MAQNAADVNFIEFVVKLLMEVVPFDRKCNELEEENIQTFVDSEDGQGSGRFDTAIVL
eukprot:CAMPEP_0116992352 /NCGR_PEP_ID=MMETSP0467-20121206/66744_1 /TAXON_ID=283647 /ORGANISM="Mesodinium pulex, Strain SPMC105" /LENGTH=57 /DNA_ID=CAMNT_0004689733 /DNA_START=201 /DNA_END=374 /DNA_ORIENTATION=-